MCVVLVWAEEMLAQGTVWQSGRHSGGREVECSSVLIHSLSTAGIVLFPKGGTSSRENSPFSVFFSVMGLEVRDTVVGGDSSLVSSHPDLK